MTTAGFEDLLEIGRQNRAELYNLTPAPRQSLADRELCFGVRERTHHDGAIALRPSAGRVETLSRAKLRDAPRGIGRDLLSALLPESRERERGRRGTMSRSTSICAPRDEISPEFREYERGSTTFINAYVGPLMQAYLTELSRARRYRIAIMQSNGGFLSARQAAQTRGAHGAFRSRGRSGGSA